MAQVERVEAAPAETVARVNKMEARQVNFFYGDFQALHDVSLPVQAHRITALIGPSGCGKTTFLRTFNRMHDLVPTARITGQVLLDGENVLSPHTDVIQLRRRVGMLFQRPNPFKGAQSALPLFVFSQASSAFDTAIQRAWAGALTLIGVVLLLTVIARLLTRRSRLV